MSEVKSIDVEENQFALCDGRYHRRAAGNAGTLFSLQGSRCAGLPAGCREIRAAGAAAGLQGQIRLVYAALQNEL